MKSALRTAVFGLAARQVAAHAIFQELWVGGTDMISLDVFFDFLFRFVFLQTSFY